MPVTAMPVTKHSIVEQLLAQRNENPKEPPLVRLVLKTGTDMLGDLVEAFDSGLLKFVERIPISPQQAIEITQYVDIDDVVMIGGQTSRMVSSGIVGAHTVSMPAVTNG